MEMNRARRNALVASAYNTVIGARGMTLPGGVHMSSAGLPDEPRKYVLTPSVADGLPAEHRIALLCAYVDVLQQQELDGEPTLYTPADCRAALSFFNP